MNDGRDRKWYSLLGRLAGVVGFCLLVVSTLLFPLVLSLPREPATGPLEYNGGQSTSGAAQLSSAGIHPAIRVIAAEHFKKKGVEGFLAFTDTLKDDHQKDSCLGALILLQLGKAESIEDALGQSVGPKPASVDQPNSLPGSYGSYGSYPTPFVPPVSEDLPRPAPPPPPPPPPTPKAGTLDSGKLSLAMRFMKKLSDPYTRDHALRLIFEAIPPASAEKLVDDSLAREAIALINENSSAANQYLPDPVDRIVLGDIAGQEYLSLVSNGVDQVRIPELIRQRVNIALKSISETKGPQKQGFDESWTRSAADAIEAQKKRSAEAEKEDGARREARRASIWGLVLLLMGVLVTPIGKAWDEFAGPGLKNLFKFAGSRLNNLFKKGRPGEVAPQENVTDGQNRILDPTGAKENGSGEKPSPTAF